MNHYLKACASDVTVVAFIIFPTKNTRYTGGTGGGIGGTGRGTGGTEGRHRRQAQKTGTEDGHKRRAQKTGTEGRLHRRQAQKARVPTRSLDIFRSVLIIQFQLFTWKFLETNKFPVFVNLDSKSYPPFFPVPFLYYFNDARSTEFNHQFETLDWGYINSEHNSSERRVIET